MPRSVRAFFEPRFGRDLAEVRIHTDAAAGQSARSLHAQAYTMGNHISFAPGKFDPASGSGLRLIAHELAHTLQPAGTVIRCQPESGSEPASPPVEPVEEPEKPGVGEQLLIYPLVRGIWNDVVKQKKFSADEIKAMRLKGREAMAFWTMFSALVHSAEATKELKGEERGSAYVEALPDFAKDLHKLTGDTSVYLDLFSRVFGIDLSAYLGSERFKGRLKENKWGILAALVIAQSIFSIVKAAEEPVEEGEFESTWVEHLGLVLGGSNLILESQLTAPSFFGVGPLTTKTHPLFGLSPYAGGVPEPGLTLEHGKGGSGQGGSLFKFGTTLNLAQIAAMAKKDAPKAEEIADVQKYRGVQGSVWFDYSFSNPTAAMAQLGAVPEKKWKGGLVVGADGAMQLLEVGSEYGGKDAATLTSWFLHGGFGYSGPKGSAIKRMGFEVTFKDWTETYIYAPQQGGEAIAGQSAQFTPFTQLEFGGAKHKFGVGAALSFVTGSAESAGISMFRGDLSYTYMGDRSEDQLPKFKIDLSGSVHRLDWWNPNSPLLWGISPRAWLGPAFIGAQYLRREGELPEERIVNVPEKDKIRVRVPHSLLITGGVAF